MQKRLVTVLKKGSPVFADCLLPKAKLYLFQLKLVVLHRGCWSNHYMELAGFVYILYVVVVELQQFGGNLERYFFRFAGFQENLFKAFQLFHRTGYTSHKVTNIKLNHFCTVSLAGIGHSHGSSQFALIRHASLVQSHVAIRECGIAQAETKGIKRFIVYVYIVAAEFLEPCTVGKRAARVLVVVVDRALTHVARERGGQTALGLTSPKTTSAMARPAWSPNDHV